MTASGQHPDVPIIKVFHLVMYGPKAALFAESFTGRLRYSGSSLADQPADRRMATQRVQFTVCDPWVYLDNNPRSQMPRRRLRQGDTERGCGRAW